MFNKFKCTYDQDASFWITVVLCVISTIFISTSFFVDTQNVSIRDAYAYISCFLTQGIFVSAFFALWKPRRNENENEARRIKLERKSYSKVKLQIAALCGLGLIWFFFWSYLSVKGQPFDFNHLLSKNKELFTAPDVVLSPFTSFLPFDFCNALDLTTLGSVILLLCLFLAGSSRLNTKDETPVESAQRILFAHDLHKRIFQAAGLICCVSWLYQGCSLFLLTPSTNLCAKICGVENSANFLLFLLSFGPICFFQIFCPLYVVLKVNRNRQRREQQAQENPHSLRPYKNSPIMIFWLLVPGSLGLCFLSSQLLGFFTKGFSALDPTTIMLSGLASTYLYLFTKDIDFSRGDFEEALSKFLTWIQKCLIGLYLPMWIFAVIRMTQFFCTSSPTPYQIWVALILISLGIFHIRLILRKNISFSSVMHRCINTCLLGLFFAKSLSFSLCEWNINSFLNKAGAFNEKKIVQKIPDPKACDLKDLKEFVRAINILNQFTPSYKLASIFGFKLTDEKERLQKLYKEGKASATQKQRLAAAKDENKGKNPDEKGGKPSNSQNLLDSGLETNTIDAVISLLGLDILHSQGGWYVIQRGLILNAW